MTRSTHLLSWPLSEDTPAYGGGESLTVERLTEVSNGDTANTVKLAYPNHLGTHIDVPRHFFDDGRVVTDYPADAWLFERPVLMDVTGEDGVLIAPEHLPSPVPPSTDLLILRTGHGEKRETEAFWSAGPGLSPELGAFLRSEHPSVRCVGVDLVSITSRLRRMEGREAHRAFLDPNRAGDPIVLIEDMALTDAPTDLGVILVAPLIYEGADGGPATVWSLPLERADS